MASSSTDVGSGIIHYEPGWWSRMHYLPNYLQSNYASALLKGTSVMTGIQTRTLLLTAPEHGSSQLDNTFYFPPTYENFFIVSYLSCY